MGGRGILRGYMGILRGWRGGRGGEGFWGCPWRGGDLVWGGCGGGWFLGGRLGEECIWGVLIGGCDLGGPRRRDFGEDPWGRGGNLDWGGGGSMGGDD